MDVCSFVEQGLPPFMAGRRPDVAGRVTRYSFTTYPGTIAPEFTAPVLPARPAVNVLAPSEQLRATSSLDMKCPNET
jgi:hypothetical protein